MKKSANHVSAAVTAILFSAMIVAAFLFYYFDPQFAFTPPKDQRFSLPVVTTQVRSADGGSHSVDVGVSLEFTGYVPRIDDERLTLIVAQAVESLDYDKITDAHGTTYIQDAVAEKLSEFIPPEEIKGVYITELQSGEYRVYTEPQPTPDPHLERAKKLFKNIDN